jgi:hypothetical protein
VNHPVLHAVLTSHPTLPKFPCASPLPPPAESLYPAYQPSSPKLLNFSVEKSVLPFFSWGKLVELRLNPWISLLPMFGRELSEPMTIGHFTTPQCEPRERHHKLSWWVEVMAIDSAVEALMV